MLPTDGQPQAVSTKPSSDGAQTRPGLATGNFCGQRLTNPASAGGCYIIASWPSLAIDATDGNHSHEVFRPMNPSPNVRPTGPRPTSGRRRLSRWLLAMVAAAAVWWTYRHYQAEQPAGNPPQFQRPVGEAQLLVEESNTPPEHPLDPVLELARRITRQMETEVVDYTATVVKRERIKGKVGNEDYMQVKIRHDSQTDPNIPFAVYLIYVPPSATAGREVIWIRGQNDDKLLTHQFGLLLKLPPTGLLAMMGNKYPVYDIGMMNLVRKLVEKGERDRQVSQCQVEIFEDQLVGDRPCRLIQVTHPEPLPELDYYLAQIYIDNELELPIRYAAYQWPTTEGAEPELEEEYTYLNLRVNVGLTDQDFSTSNPEYGFPK